MTASGDRAGGGTVDGPADSETVGSRARSATADGGAGGAAVDDRTGRGFADDPADDDGGQAATEVAPSWSPEHPDRERWNDRYRAAGAVFQADPMLARIWSAGLPPGPVLELACGPSGTALALAEADRDVVAMDVADVALEQLAAEAARRGVSHRLRCVLADASVHRPEAATFALVLALRYWDPVAFAAGCAAVRPGGLLAWEALLRAEGDHAVDLPPWYVQHGTLSAHLSPAFTVLTETVVAAGRRRRTQLLARRLSHDHEH